MLKNIDVGEGMEKFVSRIPKKYISTIDSIYKEYDGYAVELKKGYICKESESHDFFSYGQSNLMKDIRSIEKCKCEICES